MTGQSRAYQKYDHRLKDTVRAKGCIDLALKAGVPRTTALGWLKNKDEAQVVSLFTTEPQDTINLHHRIQILEKRVQILTAVMRLLLTLIRILGNLQGRRLEDKEDQEKILRAVETATNTIDTQSALYIIGLSSSRYFSWKRGTMDCGLEDVSECPRFHPTRMTPEEVAVMRSMATSYDYRHVPTNTLARLAQRLGKVFASPSTWYRLMRERNWRRPRKRKHPRKPKLGIRADAPNKIWHVDTTVFRLTDGKKAYVQAIIDNFSRKILAWSVSDKLEPMATAVLIAEAGKDKALENGNTSLMVDAGIENINHAVDALVHVGLLSRILTQTDIRYSNSMIESFWKALKHNWCFLHSIDSSDTLRKLTDFYIKEHNTVLPHSAFQGQTPDEMYLGTGEHIPDQLQEAATLAREERIEANRNRQCELCRAA